MQGEKRAHDTFYFSPGGVKIYRDLKKVLGGKYGVKFWENPGMSPFVGVKRTKTPQFLQPLKIPKGKGGKKSEGFYKGFFPKTPGALILLGDSPGKKKGLLLKKFKGRGLGNCTSRLCFAGPPPKKIVLKEEIFLKFFGEKTRGEKMGSGLNFKI